MPKSMGEIIKALRTEHHCTQETLAAHLGVTPQAISRWERDTCFPDITQIVPLANFFHISTDVLFGLTQIGAENSFGTSE